MKYMYGIYIEISELTSIMVVVYKPQCVSSVGVNYSHSLRKAFWVRHLAPGLNLDAGVVT